MSRTIDGFLKERPTTVTRASFYSITGKSLYATFDYPGFGNSASWEIHRDWLKTRSENYLVKLYEDDLFIREEKILV